jgi:hypothetical protein
MEWAAYAMELSGWIDRRLAAVPPAPDEPPTAARSADEVAQFVLRAWGERHGFMPRHDQDWLVETIHTALARPEPETPGEVPS